MGQVFFTLLNFFLAIIVDAFVEVKDTCGQLRVTQSFFRDLCSMAGTLYLQRRHKLPPPKRLVTHLSEGLAGFSKAEEAEGKLPLMSAEAMVSEFGLEQSAVCHWLAWIESLSSVPLVHYHHEEADEANVASEGDENVAVSKTPSKEELQKDTV